MSFLMNHPLKLTVREKRAKELSEETTEIRENTEGLDSCLDRQIFRAHIYSHAYF